jgi:hypothetical protein
MTDLALFSPISGFRCQDQHDSVHHEDLTGRLSEYLLSSHRKAIHKCSASQLFSQHDTCTRSKPVTGPPIPTYPFLFYPLPHFRESAQSGALATNDDLCCSLLQDLPCTRSAIVHGMAKVFWQDLRQSWVQPMVEVALCTRI